MACNKTVITHNALRFSDAGVQSTDDSADPQLPTATFIVGSTRKITFERMAKVVLGGNCSVSWSKTKSKHIVETDLDDGSLLVLDANDDKPTKSPIGDNIIHTLRGI